MVAPNAEAYAIMPEVEVLIKSCWGLDSLSANLAVVAIRRWDLLCGRVVVENLVREGSRGNGGGDEV